MTRVLPVAALFALAAPLAAQDYGRAEQFLTWNAMRHVYHDQVTPVWYADSTRFWYRVHTRSGFRFMTVNPAAGTRAPLFDNARLAAALSVAADSAIDPVKLPFTTIRFRVGTRGFRCELPAHRCAPADTLAPRTRYLRSPDGRWDAFVSGHNLWVRPAAGGDSVQLTADGVEGWSYGQPALRPGQRRNRQLPAPAAVWSPDSRRLAVERFDERGMGTFDVTSMTPVRPETWRYPYALPGDSVVGTSTWYVADVPARSVVPVRAAPEPTMSLFAFGPGVTARLQWGAGSDRVWLTRVTRGPKKVTLLSADAATGETRTVLADSAATYVAGSIDLLGAGQSGVPNWRVLRSGEVLWFAERDGFGHLYRHGPDGALRAQLTRGPWVVVALLGVDEAAGRVYFTAKGREAGRHPDYVHLYSVGLDGAGLTLLSPEDANHVVRPVPTGRYFVDAWSTVAAPPVIVLRGADGRVVTELERADIADLLATGWKPGEVFMAKARDGVTDIWGVMWKPADFDPARTYPVIDHIYPGPLISPVTKDFFPNREPFTYAMAGQQQALAQLGFVVVAIDGLGNTGRAKGAYTSVYGRMQDHGLPDHVAALRQLAMRVPQLDLARVGIYGHSGGGFASTAAVLQYPDFFRVAVSTAGNHDNRTYYHGWGERFQGLLVRDTVAKTDNFAPAANRTHASRLAGRLFLIHGDLDDNVHPAHTIGLVDALVKANRTFDLLVLPDADHNLTQHPYVIRRTWDYFVQHLLGRTPPVDYLIRPPAP
jgi:dipeptidyl-peptidase 4